MATRRPRIPKSTHRQSAQRSLVTSGAAAGRGSYVTGHSAKVIPLDAAPSLHAGDTPAGEPPRAAQSAARATDAPPPDSAAPDTRPAGPDAALGHAATARALETDDRAASALTSPAETPTGKTPAGRTSPGKTRAGKTSAPRNPAAAERRAAERRAAARRDLLRRARPGGTPSTRKSRPSPGPSRPAALEPVPARNFSGRSVALLVVLFVAAVLLAPTLRVFLDQQAELRAVQEDIAAQQEEQRHLSAEIARWDDPAYIQQQARDRFNLVMPGEKAYMVIGGDEAAEDPVPAPASPSEVNPDMPWADALWDSVVRAGTD